MYFFSFSPTFYTIYESKTILKHVEQRNLSLLSATYARRKSFRSSNLDQRAFFETTSFANFSFTWKFVSYIQGMDNMVMSLVSTVKWPPLNNPVVNEVWTFIQQLVMLTCFVTSATIFRDTVQCFSATSTSGHGTGFIKGNCCLTPKSHWYLLNARLCLKSNLFCIVRKLQVGNVSPSLSNDP